MATQPTWTLAGLAQMLSGEAHGPADLVLNRPAPAEDNDPQGIAFAETEAFLAKAEVSGVGAVIIDRTLRSPSIPHLRVDSPRMAFGMLLHLAQRPLPLNPDIHPTAVVSPLATVEAGAQIGPYAVVERGAVIGANAKIYPNVYVGENCKIGAHSCVYPHVTLYQDVTVGERAILHSGVVLGADGFGFIWDGKKRVKIPQVGAVVLGDDVEVGVNTAIDRAMAGSTRLGNGVKLDNLIQVGHNSSIGEHTVIAGMTGVPGSVNIGARCVIGGAVVINDHTNVTDDVTLGGRTGVDRDITEPGAYFGTPALPAREGIKALLMFTKLPEMMSRLRKLEKKVGE